MNNAAEFTIQLSMQSNDKNVIKNKPFFHRKRGKFALA